MSKSLQRYYISTVKSLVNDLACSTWDHCQNEAVWKFIIFMNEEWKRQKRNVRAEERKSRKMEEWRVACEMGREEKLLNDETICSVKLLAHTSTNSKTSSMATSSVAKRKTAISRNTPIFFSLMIPSPFPNYKHALIHQCESTKRYKEKLKHTTLEYTSAVKTTHTTQKGLHTVRNTDLMEI